MARRISGVGWVTVSLRRSIGSLLDVGFRFSCFRPSGNLVVFLPFLCHRIVSHRLSQGKPVPDNIVVRTIFAVIDRGLAQTLNSNANLRQVFRKPALSGLESFNLSYYLLAKPLVRL